MMDLFDEVFAAILCELWEYEANDLTIVGGIDAEIRFLDGFFNRPEHGPVPRLDQNHVRIGGADVRNAIDRGGRAVVVDLDPIEQRWTGAAGTHRLEVAAQDLHGRGHAVLGGLEDVVQ